MKLIQSRDNAFFKQLKRLAESGRERRKVGQTLLDGVHLVEAYEKAYGPLATLVVAESALAGGEVASYVAGREIVVLADTLMRDLGLVDSPSGLLGIAAIPKASATVDAKKEAILLDGVQDPGNVGTLLRIADWFGLTRVVLSPDCADLFGQKTINASMGSFARVTAHTADLTEVLAGVRVPVLGCDLAGENVHTLRPLRDAVVVIGSEGRGLSPAVRACVTQFITIPKYGGAESLNAGVAAAIVCDNLRRALA